MSVKIQDSPSRAAFDVKSAQDLRSQFQKDPQQGLKAAAQQFETLFLQQVIKSMRDATPQDGLLNSDQSRFYTGLLDQQMAQNIAGSGKGIGFARLIEQQLGRNLVGTDAQAGLNAPANAAGSALPLTAADARHLQYTPVPSALPTSAAYAGIASSNNAGAALGNAEGPTSSKEFVNRIWPQAVEASRSTGIPPQFLVGHAALESGWGRSEIRKSDGSSSYNLFGIKAGKNWNGATVDATTTEYVDGQAQQSVERFRAYSSYDEAFRDYASLLRSNPRYSGVIGSQDGAEFAKGLQRAGYATDPSYADKLSKIINGPSLRMALVG
ncbi:mannosyl-glycoprotein endo-beta-N-acetylglucosamidase [Dechloromonas denitrificans]|uniref:Peptidoglycan hydrolase FlgJ n=1 Tax=Dechloromonas denitrificans TaxID=281362 RepID=A0A133XHR2_9RHOO|nr:flagellar assembly peptidoglycan hydrolase FlgJ [Dechloromonas denitrificans]KXB30483.1 mannosyl-glycoprotein endo-beta-N-acetylglucosamidase [Dechloromonas denitrificans]